MSTIKSSAEDLTLNADGAGNDIKFQSNGVEKASLTDAGVFTATSFAGSGANLTSLPAANLTGTVATARLGTGTADSTTFLRGDQTYAEPGGGAWELLQVVNATVATSGITIGNSTIMNTSYRRYKVWFALKTPASGNWLYLRTTVSGTPQTAAYEYGGQTVTAGGSAGTHTVSSGGGGHGVLGGYPVHGPNQQIHGEIDLADCRSENWYRATYNLVGRKSTANYESFHTVGSMNSCTGSNIDGFQFYFNSGSIQPTSRVFLLGLKGS